jgi:hypothetical protein
MGGRILLSTSYFPPVEYITLIYGADDILIESRENYIKQTYRNRCNILAANGPLALTVPVLTLRQPKIPVRDVRIDYSKRWQQVHYRAIISAYRSAAFFEYFYDQVEKVIMGNHHFLLDLNMASAEAMMKPLKIDKEIRYTDHYEADSGDPSDFRYRISPKNKNVNAGINMNRYFQVFSNKYSFVPGLSFLDILFNLGPDSVSYISAGKDKPEAI